MSFADSNSLLMQQEPVVGQPLGLAPPLFDTQNTEPIDPSRRPTLAELFRRAEEDGGRANNPRPDDPPRFNNLVPRDVGGSDDAAAEHEERIRNIREEEQEKEEEAKKKYGPLFTVVVEETVQHELEIRARDAKEARERANNLMQHNMRYDSDDERYGELLGQDEVNWGRCKLTRVEDEDGNAIDFTPRSNVRDKMPRRHPPTRFIISRRRVRMVIGRIRKPGEKVSARPQKPRLGRFTQGVSATISMLAMD